MPTTKIPLYHEQNYNTVPCQQQYVITVHVPCQQKYTTVSCKIITLYHMRKTKKHSTSFYANKSTSVYSKFQQENILSTTFIAPGKPKFIHPKIK